MTPEEERIEKRKQKRRNMRMRAQGLLQGINAFLRPGDVVFDCGANVGDVTAYLAESGAQIHAFEPDPVAFERLRHRCEHYPNITLHKAAVGVRAGTEHLHRSTVFEDAPIEMSKRSTLIAGGSGMVAHEDVAVEVIDLPNMLRQTLEDSAPMVFLKIDIEGAELELLQALDDNDILRSIRLTVVEFHEGKFPHMRADFRKLRDYLSNKYSADQLYLNWV